MENQGIPEVEGIISGGPEGVKSDSVHWLDVLSQYRIGVVGGQKVVQGILRPGLSPDDAEVTEALATWPGEADLARTPDGSWSVVLVQNVSPPPPTRWVLHVFLFLATLTSTCGAGALMLGRDPFAARMVDLGFLVLPVPTALDLDALVLGAPFGVTLMAIILAHELGHFFTARARGVGATLPFFLPFPPYFSVVGTLGAFIRLRGVMIRRSTLLLIGAAGPWASFVLSIVALAWGLARSTSVPGFADPWTPFAIGFVGQPIWLGSSPVTWLLGTLILPGSLGDELIRLHPVAFAGWLGLFITMLNMLPFGQLDGGHVLYGLTPEGQPRVGRVFLWLLLPLGLLWWGWWFWAFVAVFLSRGRVGHPPVLQPWEPPDPRCRAVGWGAVLIGFLTFSPVPIGF